MRLSIWRSGLARARALDESSGGDINRRLIPGEVGGAPGSERLDVDVRNAHAPRRKARHEGAPALARAILAGTPVFYLYCRTSPGKPWYPVSAMKGDGQSRGGPRSHTGHMGVTWGEPRSSEAPEGFASGAMRANAHSAR